MNEDFNFSLSALEGIIGGSSLDELQDLLDIEDLEDDDIVFKLVDDPKIDLIKALSLDQFDIDHYEIKPNQTFVARCLKYHTEDFKYNPADLDPKPEWIPL